MLKLSEDLFINDLKVCCHVLNNKIINFILLNLALFISLFKKLLHSHLIY